MATEIVMPKLGLTMAEGQVGRWLVREGEAVHKGQPLVEVITEKITAEVEAPEDGVLLKILVPEGETVTVATPIAYVGVLGEVLADDKKEKLAHSLLSQPSGSANIALDSESDLVPLTPMRRIIAQRLTQSCREVPHFVVTREVDVSASLAFRREVNECLAPRGVRVSFTDLLIKGAALALRRHPSVNASFEEYHIRLHRAVNIGFAVSVQDGVIAPVVHDADRKPFVEIAKETKRLIQAAQAGRLAEEEISGGTFTVSNMSTYDVDHFTAIINPPQSAILAVGRIARRPYVIAGSLTVRPTCILSLACDHRVLDGAEATAFLGAVRSFLEAPAACL